MVHYANEAEDVISLLISNGVGDGDSRVKNNDEHNSNESGQELEKDGVPVGHVGGQYQTNKGGVVESRVGAIDKSNESRVADSHIGEVEKINEGEAAECHMCEVENSNEVVVDEIIKVDKSNEGGVDEVNEAVLNDWDVGTNE